MRVIPPSKVILLDCSVPDDTTTPEWDSSTNYNADDEVIVRNLGKNQITKKFKAVVANTNKYPPDNPDVWQDLGAIDRYKCLDDRLGTQTIGDDLYIKVRVTKSNSLALMNIEATDVTITTYEPGTDNIVDGPTTYNLYYSATQSWFDYFFEDITRKNLLVNIPITLGDLDVKIEFTGSPAKCGLVFAGKSYYLGETQFQARIGISDYSKKEIDDFGMAYLKPGEFAKRLSVDVMIPSQVVSAVQYRLAQLRALPCVWDANNETTDHEALVIYGFYKDFEEILQTANVSYCSIEIEGLI